MNSCSGSWMPTPDSKILGAYGRDTLNDNGELLLSFANNHDLALVNTFFSAPKSGVPHTFNGRGKKRIDYIITRQRDCKFVRNITVHPQPFFLPISDHNIVSAPVKLLGHFARNRWLRASAKPPVDRRRLVTDPQLRQEVATAVGRHLRANPPGAAVWTTWKPHSLQPSCGPLNWWSHLWNEGNQGEVGVETPERKLNCSLRLMQCTQHSSA